MSRYLDDRERYLRSGPWRLDVVLISHGWTQICLHSRIGETYFGMDQVLAAEAECVARNKRAAVQSIPTNSQRFADAI